MKRIETLFAVIIITLFVGCVPQKKHSNFENKQQQNFYNFLAIKREMSHGQLNDIQKKEFLNQFEEELVNYLDSIKLFVNWKGTIKDIKTKETGNSTAIEFEIYYKPEEYREISFFCTHIVENDSLKNDYIYNQVKNISDYSTVYFDGFIRTDNKNKVSYDWRSSGDELNIPYPKYKFWILDIGTIKRNDSLSVNLQKAVDFGYKMIQPMKLQYQNQISKTEADKLHNDMLPEFQKLQSSLTAQEKKYTQRFSTCLVYNFLYGD